MKIKSVILLGPVLLLASALFAQMQASPTLGPILPQTPMTEKEVILELKKDGAAQLTKDLVARGVDFEMDADIEKRLRKAKATDEVIKAVTAAGPKEREARAKVAVVPTGEVQLSSEESEDLKALESELDPDKAIALAEAYVKKYPKSVMVTYAYAFEAHAYETKGNAEKIVEYAEKSLDLKKDNLMSLLMATDIIPQHQYLNGHPGDEEKQLAKAEAYCQEAFKAIEALKQLPSEQEADFVKRKADYKASIHANLAMIHLARAQMGLMSVDTEELVKAEQEYKQAIAIAIHPDARDYYFLGEAYRLHGKLDDSIAAYTKASELGQGVVKQYAEKHIEALKKQKATAGAPVTP